MISADFYPTQQTQYTVEYTDVINNLTYDDPETMAEPYYMGYVKWDDVPTMQHMSKLNVVTGIEEAYVEFVDVTQTENVPWFFTGRYSTSTSSGSGIYIADESTNKYVHPTLGNHYNYGFFNSLEIQRVGSYGSFNLYVFYNIINPSTTPPTISQGASYLQYNSTSISFEDFLKWMNGEIQLFISVTIGAVQENIYFDYGDFLTGECNKEHTNGELQVWLVDVFTPYNARDYQPNNTLAQWSNQNATLKLHADIDGDIKPFLTNGLYWHSGYSDERYIRLDNAQTLSHYVSGYNGYVMGGFNGRIPYTFFAYGSTGRYYVFGNMIVWKYTSSQTRIARIIPITDIIHFLAPLATRISTTGVNPAYGFADAIAYPLFNDDNSPKWEYVTGAQVDIQDELQEWQYTNITANTFTEDDIPEYEPPSPPDEDEESGDRIPNQYRSFSGSNNFISQYALTAEQLQTFGQMLWTSWNDSQTVVDTINNFWIAWNIEDFTGSFDVSSVMSFIVSLRVFPFNPVISGLSNFVLTDKLNIGRGTFPFLFPSQVGNIVKLLSTVIYVDCGTVTVPRRFGDFKDYNNMNITCFCPYCGTVELNAGDVIGRTLHARYAVDMQTGDCLCMITMEYNGSELYNVASIAGNMGANIPVSATNSGLIMARRISDEANGIGLFGGMFTENVSMGAKQFANPYRQQSAIGAIAGAASTAMGNVFKDIQQAGQFATDMLSRGAISCPIMQCGEGFTSFAQADTPFIQMRYGIYAEPANYPHSVGRISTSSGTIGSYKGSGFITCENVDTTKLTCHNDEKAAIAAALETGVFV